MATKTKVKRGVSLSLHPAVITSIPGYEEARGYVAHSATALDSAYQSIEAVVKARAKLSRDESRTPKAQVLMAAELAEQYMGKLQKTFELSWDKLHSGIDHIDKQLSEPMEQQAGAGTISGEIRSHAKSLEHEERRKLISDALHRGDIKTTSAILGAPAYLSGLQAEEQKHYTRTYHEATNPELTRRLQVMTKAKEKLEQSKRIIRAEMDKAVGASKSEIDKLRTGSSEAEDELILKIFTQVGD